MHTKIDRITLFWIKVLRPSDSDCWVWTGATDGKGYGALNRSGKKAHAHRTAWVLLKGEIPKGMEIRHQCNNKLCCNPSHLKIGSHYQNMQDAVIKKEMKQGVPHRSSKLNPEKVKEMRRLYSTGTISVQAIGKLFGVTLMPAWAAIHKKTWKSVP